MQLLASYQIVDKLVDFDEKQIFRLFDGIFVSVRQKFNWVWDVFAFHHDIFHQRCVIECWPQPLDHRQLWVSWSITHF